MPRVTFQNNEFDTDHEAACAALFNRYGWRWEKPKYPLGGWLPDFLLKGDTSVYVECKAGLKWDEVQSHDLTKYEDPVSELSDEVLLIPEAPRMMEINKGYPKDSILGFLYDGTMWGYAELSRWSGRVGFCHKANSWKDRMSGENVTNSIGDRSRPNVDLDWRAAQLAVEGKRKSFFKASVNAAVEEWEPSSE